MQGINVQTHTAILKQAQEKVRAARVKCCSAGYDFGKSGGAPESTVKLHLASVELFWAEEELSKAYLPKARTR